jgi:hypothetical protein
MSRIQGNLVVVPDLIQPGFEARAIGGRVPEAFLRLGAGAAR